MGLRFSAHIRGSDLRGVDTFSNTGVVHFITLKVDNGFGLPLAINPLQTKIYPTTFGHSSKLRAQFFYGLTEQGVLKLVQARFAWTLGCGPSYAPG